MKKNNLKMFCLTMEPNHINFIEELNYIPVGLGDKNFPENCISDKHNDNISYKNKYYGEYTFHYWLWKNYLDKIDQNWIGFCQYRKFWSLDFTPNDKVNLTNLKQKVLSEVPNEFDDYDVILGKPFYVNNRKTMKFLKKGLPLIISNPMILFNKNLRNIKFHFDLMHGRKNMDKAINLLNNENKEDFKKFVNTEVSFNPHNMFICKSKKLLTSYYKEIFKWLSDCEKVFGFEKLTGFGLRRIYGFLAERFMPYWFRKNAKYVELPIIFHDIRDDLNK